MCLYCEWVTLFLLLLELRSCAITGILIFNPYVPNTRKEEETNFLGGSPLPHISLFAPSLYIIKCQLMSSVVKKQIWWSPCEPAARTSVPIVNCWWPSLSWSTLLGNNLHMAVKPYQIEWREGWCTPQSKTNSLLPPNTAVTAMVRRTKQKTVHKLKF